MTTSHYETLGVESAATPEEIRLAWRLKSKEHHPDKHGGDGAAQAKINAAYEVLSDTTRRKRYDDTGSDQDPTTLDDAARGTAMMALQAAIEGGAPDPITAALSTVSENIASAMKERNKAERKITRLEAMRKRVSVKQGANLAHMIIDQQLAVLRSNVAQFAGILPMLERAGNMLSDHEFADDAAPKHTTVLASSIELAFSERPTGWRPTS